LQDSIQARCVPLHKSSKVSLHPAVAVAMVSKRNNKTGATQCRKAACCEGDWQLVRRSQEEDQTKPGDRALAS
jgi:hypothetical protein